jgi:hypothetical protein
LAREASLKALKEQARERRQRAMSPEELRAAEEEAQEFRWWRTALGTIRFTGEVLPEIGLPIMNRLDAETDRLWLQAWREGKAAGGAGAGLASDQQATLAIGLAPARDRRSTLAVEAFVRPLQAPPPDEDQGETVRPGSCAERPGARPARRRDRLPGSEAGGCALPGS